MVNEVAPSKDFQERLYEKIRADIGALMTDEELKGLVEKTMKRVFFTPVKRLNSNNYREEFDPPKIEQLVKELLEPGLVKAMKAWFDENPEVVKTALDKALAGGLVSAVSRALDSIIQSHFATMQYNMQQALKSALHR